MANALYYPEADSVTQDFSKVYPGSEIAPDLFLLHSTEGSGWEPYDGGANAPHMTLKIDLSKPRRCELRQHYPANRNSRALVNAPGGAETNREDVFQLEIVATSGWASAENPSAPWKAAFKITDLPDWALREIGRIWAWLHIEWGVPLSIAAPFVAWNGRRPTMTEEDWVNAVGLIGHQHVPEGNTHTDPGDIDAERILWHAKDFVRIWSTMGYPYAEAPPAPEPLPIPEPDPAPAPAPIPPPAPAPAPAPTPKNTVGETLRLGDRGTAVTVMQKRLTAHGVPTTADGVFGKGTLANVQGFQRAKNLDDDGVVGKDTWTALQAKTAAENRARAKAILAQLGWRVDTNGRLDQAIFSFQRMWNLGTALTIDGILGPKTMTALEISKTRDDKGLSNISPNFDALEFVCKCGGKYADCRRIYQLRRVVQGAEVYRTKIVKGPFTPLSAYRCPKHNASVGGYELSAHTEGAGFDMRAVYSRAAVKAVNEFPAIGFNRSNNTVRHVDYRHLVKRINVPAISGKPNGYEFAYGS